MSKPLFRCPCHETTRDCYSFLEGMAELGGAENFEDALEKLARQGEAGGRSDSNTNGRATARLCEHACLCFHLAGLPGAASAMHIAKESCEEVGGSHVLIVCFEALHLCSAFFVIDGFARGCMRSLFEKRVDGM